MDDEYVGIHHAPGYASKEREGPEQLHQRQKKSEAVVTAKELAGARGVMRMVRLLAMDHAPG
jgi:hypothetical protein